MQNQGVGTLKAAQRGRREGAETQRPPGAGVQGAILQGQRVPQRQCARTIDRRQAGVGVAAGERQRPGAELRQRATAGQRPREGRAGVVGAHPSAMPPDVFCKVKPPEP